MGKIPTVFSSAGECAPSRDGVSADLFSCTAVPRHSRVEISREGISNSANIDYVAPLVYWTC